MCGILGLVSFAPARARSTRLLVAATHVVAHRGPDDEGYLLWRPGEEPRVYAGPATTRTTSDAHRLAALPPSAPWNVAFGHRRLSIVDLSPAGHQPMIDTATGLSITYNGEIYNHLELREELERLGHPFQSHSDTEVILRAWIEWGPECVSRFNGMFAFVILDPRDGGTLHAVRDRFGVKPLYWARVGDLVAFASEIKQIRALPGFTPHLDLTSARDYLVSGVLDTGTHTFDVGVRQLAGGERAVVPLDRAPELQLSRWYSVKPRVFQGSLADAANECHALLADSVSLRLRADVPVGSCLSGGLDSSAIVCLARAALEAHGRHEGQVTVTARYELEAYDEWRYAQQIITRTQARAVEVWPSVERLQAELDRLIWHMDEPFVSTSQFSQWCVFSGAADAGLKVMLDGQGSDEQLAGYAGNDTSFFAGLMRRGSVLDLVAEVTSFRSRMGSMPVSQLLLAARNVVPSLDRVLPQRVRLAPEDPAWLRLRTASRVSTAAPRDLNDSLMRQTLSTSLPVLLRYEDRNSMAWSIESRVPFLDYRLVEFLAGLPDSFKLRRGWTKLVFREAMRGVLPEDVRARRDKMGFVTPEQVWVTRTATEWFREQVRAAVQFAPDVFEGVETLRMFEDIARGRTAFSFLPWRVLCFGRWLRALELGEPARNETHLLAAPS
jgi:asparagine synthase (glutamine-hydrolysing)